ncbi:hypothetical protein [Dokdonella sp.]|uniref:hypothetical protein n=1 Tax=Dokdonella sp. TaxID=2291710 RepID=UPI002F41AB5C
MTVSVTAASPISTSRRTATTASPRHWRSGWATHRCRSDMAAPRRAARRPRDRSPAGRRVDGRRCDLRERFRRAGHAAGLRGPITADNSLLGRAADDFFGFAVYGLSAGEFVAWSPFVYFCDPEGHCGGSIGAVTPSTGLATSGRLSLENSAFGHVQDQGTTLSAALNGSTHVLIVGQPEANIVSLLKYGDSIFRNGFETR